MRQLLAFTAPHCDATCIHTFNHHLLHAKSPIIAWQGEDGVQELDYTYPEPQPHGPTQAGQHLGHAEPPVVPVGHLHLVGEGDVDGGVGDVLLHLIEEVGASCGRCAWQWTDLLWWHQSALEEIAVDSFRDVCP